MTNPKERWKINPVLRFRWETDAIECVVALEHQVFEVGYEAFATVMALDKVFSTEESLEIARLVTGGDEQRADKLIGELVATRIIVPLEYKRREEQSARHWAARGWIDALFLHLASRNLHYCDDDENPALPKGKKFKELPEPWKYYDPHATRVMLTKGLNFPPGAKADDVMSRRKTSTKWKRESPDLCEVSTILYAANSKGKLVREQVAYSRRRPDQCTYSNSAFIALETCVFIQNSDRVPTGLYDYDFQSHELVERKLGLSTTDVQLLIIGQPHLLKCPFVIFIMANWEQYQARYKHSRAYLNLMTNVSELGHKYLIAATAFDLGTWLTPAFNDQRASKFFECDLFSETPIYAIGIG